MTISNARLIAELQAVTLGIHLVGLDRLPEVVTRALTPAAPGMEKPSSASECTIQPINKD